MNQHIPPADASPIEMANALGITDPRVLQLLQIMSAKEQEKEDEDEAPVVVTRPRAVVDRKRYDRLCREHHRLLKETRNLIRHVETLAAALGACPVCWGEDGRCGECRGRGRPGAFVPDKDAFDEFVLPTVRRMQKRRRGQRRPAQEIQPALAPDFVSPTPEAVQPRQENE